MPDGTILLIGLEGALNTELAGALSQQGCRFQSQPRAAVYPPDAQLAEFSLVFCAADSQCYEPVLESLRCRKLNIPVVIVSRGPDILGWLDALEAGASDYCSPPFEPVGVASILGNARSRLAA